jgi:hypothetical protein
MVDYSKWDRFEDSCDDDEEANNNDDRFTSPTPRVTRLEAPSTITTHADGTIHIAPTNAVESSPTEKGVVVKGVNDAAADKSDAPGTSRTIRFVGEQQTSDRIKGDNTIGSTPAGGIIPVRTTVPAPHWTAQGSRQRRLQIHDNDDYGRNGENDDIKTNDDDDNEMDLSKFYYWSQDRDTVTVRILLLPSNDSNARASYDVQLTAPLAYRDRNVSSLAAPGSQRLTIRRHNNRKSDDSEIILDRVLAYAVHLAEDDDDDGTVDWCIQPLTKDDMVGGAVVNNDDPCRVLILTLRKATPMVGVHVWWQRLFVDEPDRDESSDPIARRDRQEQFQATWERAHEEFRTNLGQK